MWRNLLLVTFGMTTSGLLSFAQVNGAAASPATATNNEVTVYNTTRINTESVEFSPVFYETGLVYVSQYRNGPINPRTGETYFEIFYADLDPNGMPGKPQPFSSELNSAYHEGPVSFSRKGDRIFFTRTNSARGVRRADSKGVSGLKIYEARRGPYDWENVKELPFNSDEYTCMHPALSADENKLFFASNMAGGFGGMDLYVVEWRGNEWSQPINLGPEVNTTRNEAFPFMHESGSLFFASDGHTGLGGFDIFMINMAGRRWGSVTNLGPPFNSQFDDLGFNLLPNGKRGYFSSSRTGGFGKDDIYMFSIAGEGFKGIDQPVKRDAVATVYDASNSRRLLGASLWLYESSSDGMINNAELYDLVLSTDETSGEAVVKMVRKPDEELGPPHLTTDREGVSVMKLLPDKDYLMVVGKSGYFTQELNFRTSATGQTDKPLEILLSPSNCITLNGIVKADKYQINIPNAVVRITNDCNTEVTIARSNINGEFEVCLLMGCVFTVRAEKPGYEGSTSTVSTVRAKQRTLDAQLLIRPTSDAVLREPIAKGTVIVMENILYDFNRSSIRKGAARDLEALAQLMSRYASMEIELGAHTDSRGTDDYNQDLSERRAESAKEFLVQRGISPDRITTVGYGERFLRNNCTDEAECSESEHAYNRRTEVKITRIDESASLNYNGEGIVPDDNNNDR